MVSERDRMIEWLNRARTEISLLRKKPRLGKDKHLACIRENYGKLNTLIKVAERKAYMMGISPPIKK